MVAEKIESVSKKLLELSKNNNQNMTKLLQLAAQELLDASYAARTLENNLIIPLNGLSGIKKAGKNNRICN